MLEAIQRRVQFFGALGIPLNRFLTIFKNFSSKMGPKMDPKINGKSVPRQHGPSQGPKFPPGPHLGGTPPLSRTPFWTDF